MHTYFYVDLDDNGKFSNELNNDGTPAGELLSYSHYNGKNSTGATQVPGITPATSFPFVIPAETKPGCTALASRSTGQTLILPDNTAPSQAQPTRSTTTADA